MEKMKGPWKVKETHIQYKDSFLTLQVDEVIKPDGRPGTFATVTLRKGVAILPIDEFGNIFLTKQYRYGIEEDSIEVVSGGIEGEDAPIKAAKKELKEEAGIVADEWQSIGLINMDTAIVKCPVHLFIVKKLHFEEPDQEGTEDIKVFKVAYKEAVNMVLDNQITHAPSCVLLLKAQHFLQDFNLGSNISR